ncbi:MAG: hypothetical protein AB1715_09795 [Acidobacteriota bacterium]
MLKFVAFQATPSLQKQALPYWIFWFMLFIILLLVLFIFLRDRGLRRRLSAFLAGARRRSVLLQLKFRLKRERQKKMTLLKKLGAAAWDEDLPLEGGETIRSSLRENFEKRNAAQLEWKNALAELERNHKRLEEAVALHEGKIREQTGRRRPLEELLKRKREEERHLKKLAGERDIDRLIAEGKRELEEIRARLGEIDHERREIEAEDRDQRREIEKEIHFWKRKKQKIQDQIKEIEARQEVFYHSLGELLEEKRQEAQGLARIYGEIDLVNHHLTTLQHRIETLSGR